MPQYIYQMHMQQNRCFVSQHHRRPSDVEIHAVTEVSTQRLHGKAQLAH
jgi:hypothetical protein